MHGQKNNKPNTVCCKVRKNGEIKKTGRKEKNEQSSPCRVRVRALYSFSQFGYNLSERQGTTLLAKSLTPGCVYIGRFYYALSNTNFVKYKE